MSLSAAEPSDASTGPQPDAGASAAAAGNRHLLLVKLGAIGDVLMVIPAAAAMYAQGFTVTWVVSETVAPVLRLYPWMRVIAANEAKLLRGSPQERLSGVLALWRSLRRECVGEVDLCATLYYDRRYRLLTLPVRARRRLHLSWQNRDCRLLPGRQHTAEYVRILEGRKDGVTPAEFAPVPVPWLPAPAREVQPSRPRVVLVPGGARNVLRENALRRWPVENYVAVARRLLARGLEVVLIGGPDDVWVSAHFSVLVREAGADRIGDLIGRLPLVQTLAVIDSAAVTVTHDTGPLHMAGITATAIVAVFGPTDPHTFLPQRENSVALWGGEGFACRPCYDGRDFAPCSRNDCMAQVTPAMVMRQVEELLSARTEGRHLPPRVLTPDPAGLRHLAPPTGVRG